MEFNFPEVDKHSIRLYIVNFNIIDENMLI